MLIRSAKEEEWDRAMDLAWHVFNLFDAPEYTPRGTQSFREFLSDRGLFRMFQVGSYELFLALEGEEILGLLSLRNVSHISLLFVREDYHFQGIGKALVEYAASYVREETDSQKLTVFSSPYATAFYHKLGFVDTGLMTETDGIRYTPMELCF